MLKKYHPDVYDGDPEFAQNKTALINECYATLKDDEKRKAYDIELEKFEPKQEQTNKTKSEDDFVLREFFRRFKTNLHKDKPQKEKKQKIKTNLQKTKVQKNEKEDSQVTKVCEDDSEKRENKKLTIYIIIILAIILGIIALCMIID